MSGPTSGAHDRSITQREGVDHDAQPRGLHPRRGGHAHDAGPPGIPRPAPTHEEAESVPPPQPPVLTGRLMAAAVSVAVPGVTAPLSGSSDKMEDMAVDQAAPIFGRDRELAQRTAALGLAPGAEATGSNSGLLGGDAGIGKTRVLTELVAAARETDHRVLVGHCLDLGDSAMPFQPFVEALAALEPGERDELLALSPALAGLLATPESDDGAER